MSCIFKIHFNIILSCTCTYSFFAAVISTSILSHTVRFHLFISTYVVKLVAGTVL
jgi:hypothetical protein